MAHKIAKKQVTDSHYDGRIQSVRNWYAEKRNLWMDKKKARKILDLQPWQYLQVVAFPYYRLGDHLTFLTNMCIFVYMQCPPPYVGKARPEIWSAMVNWYTSKGYKKEHEAGRVKRAAMGGGSHSQGNIRLAAIKHAQVRKCILLTLLIMLFLIPQMRPSSCIFVLSFAGTTGRRASLVVQDLEPKAQDEGQGREREVGEHDGRSQEHQIPCEVRGNIWHGEGPRGRAL